MTVLSQAEDVMQLKRAWYRLMRLFGLPFAKKILPYFWGSEKVCTLARYDGIHKQSGWEASSST